MRKFLKILFFAIIVPLLLVAGYFFLIRKLDAKAANMKDFYTSAHNTQTPTLLPSLFLEGQRFYIKIATPNGDTAMAYGDTGGGISMLLPPAVDKLALKGKVKRGLVSGLMPLKYVLFNDISTDKRIPEPVLLRNKIVRHPFARVKESFLAVPPIDDELKFMMEYMSLDIFLGQNFFMGRAWTFDYIHQQVWVNTSIPLSDAGKPGVQKIGFKKNSNNESIFGHPSFAVEINGEVIDVLFDTGASIVLAEEGQKAFHTTKKTIGGSFIAAPLFDKWKKEHPEWKFYAKVDKINDVIEVPVVKIGGYEVGPVLFSRRPPEAWSQYMISSMDKVVKGAIGGSALQYFKVTIDYNSELVKFEK